MSVEGLTRTPNHSFLLFTGGTHLRRATFDRCEVRGVVLRVVVCGVALVVCCEVLFFVVCSCV